MLSGGRRGRLRGGSWCGGGLRAHLSAHTPKPLTAPVGTSGSRAREPPGLETRECLGAFLGCGSDGDLVRMGAMCTSTNLGCGLSPGTATTRQCAPMGDGRRGTSPREPDDTKKVVSPESRKEPTQRGRECVE